MLEILYHLLRFKVNVKEEWLECLPLEGEKMVDINVVFYICFIIIVKNFSPV